MCKSSCEGTHTQLLQTHQRDINCLADDNRQTRQRALKKLATIPTGGHTTDVVGGVWEHGLRTPLLKLFSDPVEKNRETAVSLMVELIPALPKDALIHSLAHIVP